VKKYGVNIAQHGITGTPLHLVGRFADYGIRKGNVGTEWQNIAHRNLPDDLMNEMKKWAKEAGKDIKFTTKQFLKEINGIPEKYKKAIMEESRKTAIEYFKSFRAVGSATAGGKGILMKNVLDNFRNRYILGSFKTGKDLLIASG
jgi:fructose-bisphosphate aldolase class II